MKTTLYPPILRSLSNPAAEEMQALLQHYRAELLAESGRLLQEGAT